MFSTTADRAARARNHAEDYFEGRRRQLGGSFKRLRPVGVGLYRGPLAATLGKYHLLLLTTTGRRTGLPRTTVLTFMPEPAGFGYVVAAGLGERSDWYRNLLAQPRVNVRVGQYRFEALGAPILEPALRRLLAIEMLPYWDRFGPPPPVRWLLRWLWGFDYEAEMCHALEHAEDLPLVVLTPLARTPTMLLVEVPR